MYSAVIRRNNRKNSIFKGVARLAFLLCLSIQFIGGASSQSISVLPSRIFFQVESGGLAQKDIQVTNPGTEPIVFTTSLRDWSRDSLGNKVYSDPGSLKGSNAKWLTIAPAQVTIAPGQSKSITVTLRAPKEALPITNSMLFLSQINEQQPIIKGGKNGKVALDIRLEVGIHIYNTLPDIMAHKNLYFTSIRDYGPNSDSTDLLSIKVKNGGNVVTDGLLKLEITNMATGATYKIPDRAISMFPDSEQVIQFNLPLRLPKGKYQLVAILDAGANSDLKVAKKQLSYE